MRTQITFFFTEDDSRTEPKAIMSAKDMASALWEIDQVCRTAVKHGDGKIDADEIRDLIRHWVNLEDIIE